jgi:hypothetical protein
MLAYVHNIRSTISLYKSGSIHDEVIDFSFQFTYSFQPYYGLGIYSNSNRKWVPEEISERKAPPARKADNLTAIYEQTV